MSEVDDEEERTDLEYEGRVQRSGQTYKTTDSRCMMGATALQPYTKPQTNKDGCVSANTERLSTTLEHHLISTPLRRTKRMMLSKYSCCVAIPHGQNITSST